MEILKIKWRQPRHYLKCMFCGAEAENIVKISAQEGTDLLFSPVVCNICAGKTETELLELKKSPNSL